MSDVPLRLAYLSIGRHLHTERWIQFFAARGHECHLLTVQPGPVDGVTVHDITRSGPGKPFRYWRSLSAVKETLAQIKPDLLHTHFLTGYGYWGHFSGFHPNVLTVWGDDVYVTPHETPVKKWLAQRALQSCEMVTGDSVDILKDCAKLGADPAKCFEVHWGVDFDHFRPNRESDVRSSLGIPEDAPVLFSPRSFTQPYYNIDIIIQATARITAQRPDVHVIFAGYEGESGPFEAKARAAGLGSETHFVGRIPHDRFADYLSTCDVFISVPSVDATAVSLLEAMACGCGIVVSSLPSSMEWIFDGENGWVVPPRDVDALVRALNRLLDQPEERAEFGRRCVKEVRSRADHEVNMERMGRMYQHLVRGTPAPVEMVPITQDPRVAC